MNALAKLSVAVQVALLNVTLTLAAESSDKISESAKQLDESIDRVEAKVIAPEVGRILEVEPALVETALVKQKHKLSGIALAKVLSDKTREPLEKLLEKPVEFNWVTALKDAGVSAETLMEQIDGWYTEISFVMLEHRDRSKGKRKK